MATLPQTQMTLKPSTGEDPKILSVSNLNQAIRGMLEGEFPLLWLKGEISNFKPHTSGHFYFVLKDSKSQVSAVMFRGFNAQLRFKPQDGMEVVIRGKVTVYEPRGNYQVFVEIMEPVGQGALQQSFEKLKAKLSAEGLFAPAKKRALPKMPRRVALITSPTGAAIRDMITVLGRRFRGLEITVIPTAVQGAQAPREIVAAIELANRVSIGGHGFDVMIVGRGGGSIEDLWGFNDEAVARAIANSKIPTVSAVGHEIDFTIADFVADVRAPTPSAAAEIIVKNAADLTTTVLDQERQVKLLFAKKLQMFRFQVNSLAKQLVDPKRKLMDLSMKCDDLEGRLNEAVLRFIADHRSGLRLLSERLGTPEARVDLAREKLLSFEKQLSYGVNARLQSHRSRLRELGSVLDSMSPLRVVDRGYSIVTINGQLVKDATSLKVNEKINIRFAKGSATASVVETSNGI